MKEDKKVEFDELFQLYSSSILENKGRMELKKDEDADGCHTSSFSGDNYRLGVYSYLSQRDRDAFVRHLRKAVLVHIKLCQRKEAGEKIAYVGAFSFKEILIALASGHFDLALELAGYLDRLVSRPKGRFAKTFGKGMFEMLLAYLLNKGDVVIERALSLLKECARKPAAFQGYAKLFEAIVKKDLKLGQEGLEELAKGHPRLRHSIYYLTEANLNVWGLGMANLARWRGLAVDIDDEYLPRELLVEVGGGVK